MPEAPIFAIQCRFPDRRKRFFYCSRKKVKEVDYPVIDPVGTGMNLKMLIANSGNTVAGVGRMLGIADRSTMYKWLRGDALPGIDNLLALSRLLDVSINDILVTR